jgi:hypothetical protein
LRKKQIGFGYVIVTIKTFNMYYKGKQLNTIGEVFKVALRLAKKGTPTEQKNFFQSYADTCAYDHSTTFDEGVRIARSNLGYFSGYYDNETSRLIHETYCRG